MNNSVKAQFTMVVTVSIVNAADVSLSKVKLFMIFVVDVELHRTPICCGFTAI